MSHESEQEIKVPINHVRGETGNVAGAPDSRMFPDRMEIKILPKAKQVVVEERWFIQFKWYEPPVNAQKSRPVQAPGAKHFYGNTRQDIRDETVLAKYFAHLRDAAQELWNGKLQLTATQEGHHPETYDLVFRISRTNDESSAHWKVYVNTGGSNPDHTDWVKGTIELHLNSATPLPQSATLHTTSGKQVAVTGAQMGVAHEFGHSIGMHNDDQYYRPTYSDAEIRHKTYLNIMNIGQVIDAQNANFIVEQINYHYRNRLKTHKQFAARKRK